MGELASQAGKKLLGVGILVVAAFVLFKIVLSVVAGVAWFAVVIVAIIAVIWAFRVL